jgi:AraC-like DNA-binding protein
MHHAIEYQHFSTPHLQVGARKRSPMGQLLRVTQGAALLRLGAHELLLTAGSHFWLCADALAAFTPLAGCHYDRLICSLRVAQPAQAGWLQPTPLLDALLGSLASWNRKPDWQGAYGNRLRVIQDELQHCVIQQQADQPLQSAWLALASQQEGSDATWQFCLDQRHLAGPGAQPLRAQWQLLQAVRLLRSGSKPAQVMSKLGYSDGSALDEACQQWLGLTLDALLQQPSQ